MKKSARSFVLPAFVLPAFALLALLGLPALVTVADAGDRQTLFGEYVWNSRRPDDLRAVFTAAGENRWDVAFHFRFRGSPEVFRGTATGSLTEGRLEGRVKNDGRTFTFRGEFEDGEFSGTHAEVFGRRESATGTLTLKRRGQPAPGVL